MGAFEQTKCRRSVVSETFQSLSQQAGHWREKIDLLEAGQRLDQDETIAELGRLLDTCQNLRDAILSEDGSASWKTRSELGSLVNRLEEAAEKRSRYLDLAQILVAGTVSHRRERTRQERLRQRDAAVAELMEISAMSAPPDLPGPEVDKWLEWACSLEDGSNDPDLSRLNASFPRLDEFVGQLEFDLWQSGPVSKPEHILEAVRPAAAHREEVGETVEAESASPEAAVEAEAESEFEPIEEPVQSTDVNPFHDETEVEAPETQAEPARRPEGLEPKERLNRKLSFFDLEEVDYFKRYMEEAKTEPKIARSVRSLLAISQWLLPADQNPVLHATVGMRAQIGYTGSSDLLSVSPQEASRAIEAENGLLLLTGGADLLRWSIAQRAEGHFDAISAVRRFGIDEIKSWFSDLYKIELAEPQIHDVLKLTSGIPLLVGELHRLVLPNPKTPPTWLGFAIWTNIKSGFERRLPVLARELRNGSPAVRLTEQEIRVLKMVVIASDDSTPETIARNLKEDWDRYQRPEIQALSAKDEPRVRLLQSLGLLPMKSGYGLGPMQSLLPVDADDALRQIVSYL